MRGGHGVSGDTIERRFETSKENFLTIAPICDSVIIYDNTKIMSIVAYILNGTIECTPNKASWAEELLNELKHSQE